MSSNVIVFLQGVCAAGAWTAGLFFLRFWYESRDRLFAMFGIAFWMMSANWALLGLISPTDERRTYIYVLRLLAFLLIVVGIADKNRGSKS